MTANFSFSVFQYFTVTSLMPISCLLSISLLSRWWVINFHILPHSCFPFHGKTFYFFFDWKQVFVGKKWSCSFDAALEFFNLHEILPVCQDKWYHSSWGIWRKNCSTSTNLDSFNSLHTLLNYSIIFCFDQIFFALLWASSEKHEICHNYL